MNDIVLVLLGSLVLSAADGIGASGGSAMPTPRDRASAPRPALDAAVVDGCVACHKGELSLSGESTEELVVAIRDIAAGRAQHLVPIPELSDEDIQALAEALAGP